MQLLNLDVVIGAVDRASGQIPGIASKITGGLGKAVAGVAKIAGAATLAAGAGAVAVGTAAVDAYASYEQLAGGVEKLFGDASDTVKSKAQGAYAAMGLSANDYMSQVTSFSAALIGDLGGDTSKAAEAADTAMASMADNVSIFGSNVEDVQNAYQGFAKQNYSMLDNLKLGYGGTKTEMERLIEDANEYAASIGESSDLSIDSFADVVEAIDLIQRKQGIAGNAAKEAGATIEGSVNKTKAAWQNLLTEMGKDDGDVGARMQELVESATSVLIGTVDENGEQVSTGVLGRVQTIITNVSQALPTMMPVIQQALQTALPQVLQILSTMLPIVLQLVGGLFTAVGATLPTLFQTVMPVLVEQLLLLINTLTQNMPQMFEAAGQLFGMITQALVTYGPQILTALGTFLVTLFFTILNNVPNMLSAAGQLFMAIVTAIGEALPQVLETAGQMLSDLWDRISSFDLASAGADLVQGLINGIGGAIGGVADALMGGLQSAVDSALSFLGIASPSKLFDWVGQMSMEGLAGGIEDTAAKAEKATEKAVQGVYGSASGTVNADVSAAPANNQILDALNGIRESMNMSVYLDSTTLVGGIAPTMNTALGRL